MKRYRVMSADFDYRANVLNVEIQDNWQPDVKSMWRNMQSQVVNSVIQEFGQSRIQTKLENLNSIGAKPSCLIAYHNSFFSQVRDAYVLGAYYPALTGACALAERIFNQLILTLRKYFKGTAEYRKVHNKSSFDNWDLAISTLEAWNVLIPEALEAFQQLKGIRHKSIHFNSSTEPNVKRDALASIKLVTTIIDHQFSSIFNNQEWYISGIPGGVAFIKKEAETLPFVKEVLIPNSELVGYKHDLVNSGNVLVPKDDYQYEDKEITDEEFRDLYNATHS